MFAASQQSTPKPRSRKVLTLEERVQAIRLYEVEHNYQRVARKFECNKKQIRKIVSTQDSILNLYVRCQIIQPADEPLVVREKKIHFLGTVVFEFLKRAQFHYSNRISLSDNILQQRAMNFKHIIDIDRFYPTRNWIQDFKRNYKVDFDIKGSVLVTLPPEPSLDSKDIVKYCQNDLANLLEKISITEFTPFGVDKGLQIVGKLEENSSNGETVNDIKIKEEIINDELETSYEPKETTSFKTEVNNMTNPNEMQIKTEVEDNDGTYNFEEPSATQTLYTNSFAPNTNLNRQAPKKHESSITRIRNYTEALSWLRPLEIFTLDREDFTGLNMLAQLVRHYEAQI